MKGSVIMRTMKKFSALALAALLSVSAIVPASAAPAKVITQSKVKSIVRKSAPDLKNSKLSIDLETDNGVVVYEVEGKTKTREYEFEVDAYTGKIIERDWESRSKSKGKKKLTKAEARKVVDKNVTARKNQKNYKVEVDYDDNVKIYEIEFKTGSRKYEVEVNATTGKLCECDWILLKKSTDKSKVLKTTRAEAITIAKNRLATALKLTDAQKKNIKVVSVEFDYDDDDKAYDYEIELEYKGNEAEVEVHANTGKITEFELDRADDDDDDDDDKDDIDDDDDDDDIDDNKDDDDDDDKDDDKDDDDDDDQK